MVMNQENQRLCTCETNGYELEEPKEKEKEKDKEKDKAKDKAKEYCAPDDAKRPISGIVQNYGFDRFWEAYPNHKAKVKAMASFQKLKPDEQLVQTMLEAIERAKRSKQWTRDNGEFIPLPATWLNQRRWEDEQTIAGLHGYSERSYQSIKIHNALDDVNQEDQEC